MKIKNLKIRKKLVSAILAGSIALTATGVSLLKTHPNLIPNKMANGELISLYLFDSENSGAYDMITDSYIDNIYSYNSEWDLVVYKKNIGFVKHMDIDDHVHDESSTITPATGQVTITTWLRFRLGPSTNYKYTQVLPANAKAEVLGTTTNNWYVIKYKNQIGYVCGDYVKYDPTVVYDHPELTNPNAIYAYTNANVNFRVGPSTLDTRILTIPKGTKVEYISCTDTNWFKIKYNGQTGYLYGKYLNYTPEQTYTPTPETVPTTKEMPKIVYANKNTDLKDSPTGESNTLYNVDKYEVCTVVSETADWYQVNCGGYTGYIPKSLVTSLTDLAIIVDISEQKLRMYKDGELILETNVVTGKKDSHDTPHGLYSIQSKKSDTYLTGADYRVHVDYWMPFYYGYGLHDADWRSTFGGTYYEKDGSHGCVNIPDESAKIIYDTVSVGTKVLVHK